MSVTKLFRSRRGISEIISIILVILVATILVGSLLTFSKDSTKTKLDSTSQVIRQASTLECSNSQLEVEFCAIDIVTREISLSLTNNTPLDFGGFTLSIDGTTTEDQPLVFVGYFDDVIRRGESKRLDTTQDNFNIVREDYSLTALDTDNINSIVLTNKTCANNPINISWCSVSLSCPIFSLSSGTYSSAQDISLSAEEGSTIYYTLDGSTPTITSSIYSAPIHLSEDTTTTIKAFTYKSG